MDREYKTDAKSESSKASAVYSTGFFLLKHEVAYPKDNVLTFYSLYRHTAKLSDYKSGIEEIVGITKSADNKIVIRDAKNQPLNPRVELKNGVTIGVRRNTKGQEQFDELLWYRETQGNKTIEHKPKSGEHWRIFHQSYEEMQSEQIKGLPLLSKHKIDTQADVEVKLDKPIEIKAGEELGLMGEYNQIGESGEKLLHLEVFTYDNIEQFKAKAEAAYKQDREKKGIKDNFLYVARGSQLYSIVNDEAVALEKSQVEIMVPLADVAKKTVKKKIAYMLATAKHETGHTFEPITERGNRSYFNKYDPVLANTPERRKRAIDMENTQQGDGFKYRGRGYVQLTWKKNYRKSGEYLKKDLVNNPELALDQKNATKIMIYGMETRMFTTKKISSYISEDSADYLNARRVINGMDKAASIAGYASKLEECLR